VGSLRERRQRQDGDECCGDGDAHAGLRAGAPDSTPRRRSNREVPTQ
jgi:hypothetical protein